MSRVAFFENSVEEISGDLERFRSDCLFLRFSNDEAIAFLARVSAGSSREGAGSDSDVTRPVPGWVWLS